MLITKWTGETRLDLRKDKEFFTKLLENNCLSNDCDGSGDEKIHPQGLKDCVFKEELCVASHTTVMFSMLNLSYLR